MLISVLIGILILYGTISTFLLIKLISLKETAEFIITTQKQTLQEISDYITESQVLINTVDEKGIFQADDEVGDFFKYLKDIQNALNLFNERIKNG